jgi:hypothetical protein
MSYFRPTSSKAVIHPKHGKLSLSALDVEVGKELLFETNRPHVIELTPEGMQKCFSADELISRAKATSDIDELYRIAGMTYKKSVLRFVQDKVDKLMLHQQ